MNLPKPLSLSLFAFAGFMSAAASAGTPADKAPEAVQQQQEAVRLPVLTVMADRELREETVIEPAEEEPLKRKALQQQVMKLERNTQNYAADPSISPSIEMKAPEPAPNLASLNPVLQQHVLNIAEGLQSSDPRNGIYTMLQPFGIDRNAINVQLSREQVNLGIMERNAGSR